MQDGKNISCRLSHRFPSQPEKQRKGAGRGLGVGGVGGGAVERRWGGHISNLHNLFRSHAPKFVSQSGHPVLVKKKRGRPKGSKNKPKSGSLAKNNACAEGSDDDSDRPGGGARLPIVDVMPRISKEKAAMYSIILSDINQKMLSQSSMNLMLS